MKNTFKEIVEVLHIERLNNTAYGNPRYLLTLKDENGNTYNAHTKSDAGWCYGLSSYINNDKKMKVEGRETKTKIIIDLIDNI